MADRRAGLVAVLAAAACLLVVAAGVLRDWRPFLTTEREVVTATPSLAGLFQRDVVDVPEGSSACVAPVFFDEEAAQAELLAVAPDGPRPAPELLVAARSDDGSYRATTRGRPAARGADVPVRVRFAPPPEQVTGRLCVRNLGPGPVGLVGTAEGRSNAPAQTSVDGQAVEADVALTLLEAERASLLERFGEVLEHASSLTGGLLPRWLLWLVSAGIVLGVLAGLPFALWRAVLSDGAGRGSTAGSS